MNATACSADRRPTEDNAGDGPAPAMSGTGRLKIAIGVAMILVSLAGLAYSALDIEWGLHQQVFYALVGGLTSWTLVR